MSEATLPRPALDPDVCVRALQARDARFDGVFFVGITSTSIYCRPVCPARVSRPDHRRFFESAACAERAGYRPCRRCRPELAPGRALVDAVSHLASAAARRIAAGALNGRTVRELAAELYVGERHLRRALERELGVSPVELAQTHRLLLAKQLLTDTSLPISSVAYTSGFQSLRRFNALFRERYGMRPSSLRRGRPRQTAPTEGLLRLTLGYREPYAWETLVALLARDRIPGVEVVIGARFGRTVRIGDHAGVVLLDLGRTPSPENREAGCGSLAVHVSSSLLPVLMPLLARLRQMLDLDAEPSVIDACLARGGLGALVRTRPGLRIPGAFDGFEAGLRTLLRGRSRPGSARSEVARRVVEALGEPVETGVEGLGLLFPDAARVADAGAERLAALGVPPHRARTIEAFARAAAAGRLRLEAGGDPEATRDRLAGLPGIGDRLATTIAIRALGWPDTFPARDPVLQRAAGAATPEALEERARRWRPWRAYAAVHLWMQHAYDGPARSTSPRERRPAAVR
jgi:AraC family transcriptional regulator, regulatory protein of adaptative response / DNA-3-methyladenine glycosylase II